VSDFDLESWLHQGRSDLQTLLEERLPALPDDRDPGRLVEAMRYSLLAPGKRLRPLLALAAAQAVGVGPDQPIRIAALAVELVHCYSLIHDDLPAMDDDDFRRGQPSSHKAFGEATALLAGDALLTLAFEWLAEAGAMAEAATPGVGMAERYLRATTALARGAGMCGMVRGQARDLGEAPPSDLSAIETLHAEKTGALFRTALEIGGHIAGASGEQLTALACFGENYGIAFQHADDLADEEFTAFAAEAERRIHELTATAIHALDVFHGRAEVLRGLALRLQSR
jgi:geranylgeranyl diphosphate synthase type II